MAKKKSGKKKAAKKAAAKKSSAKRSKKKSAPAKKRRTKSKTLPAPKGKSRFGQAAELGSRDKPPSKRRKKMRTKIQMGRRKAIATCPNGTTLVAASVAGKDTTGKKHTRIVGACVRGRFVGARS